MIFFLCRHNDWAWLLRTSFRNNITGLDVDNMRNNHFPKNDTPTHTDITRLRKGQVGGQVCRRNVYVSFEEDSLAISSGLSTHLVIIKEKMQQLVLWNKSM